MRKKLAIILSSADSDQISVGVQSRSKRVDSLTMRKNHKKIIPFDRSFDCIFELINVFGCVTVFLVRQTRSRTSTTAFHHKNILSLHYRTKFLACQRRQFTLGDHVFFLCANTTVPFDCFDNSNERPFFMQRLPLDS